MHTRCFGKRKQNGLARRMLLSALGILGPFGCSPAVEEALLNALNGPPEATPPGGSAGPVSCAGAPPATALITGSPSSSIGGPFTYAAPGLIAPVATPLTSSDGAIDALQVSAEPGIPTDPGNAWFGVGLFFDFPTTTSTAIGTWGPCVDASRYRGIEFTIIGDLGTCSVVFGVNPAEDVQAQFGGVCQASTCYGPSSPPVGAGTTRVGFADMAGGTPMARVDPSALQGIQWSLLAPADGLSEPCVANFTIRDVAFFTDPQAGVAN